MISSILLAAGMSTRMGQPKALLDWGGEPLICYQIRQLQEAGVDEVVVVLGYRADDIHRKLHGLTYRSVLNPVYQLGRAGSLRAGAKAVSPEASAIVLLNVDQPRPADLIRSVIEGHTSADSATRPVHGERHGHPVVVAGRLRGELLAATEDERGLRGVMEAHVNEIVDVPSDERCLLDLNTPDEYEAALAALAGDS
ncbi:MAG: nucleotidyltransferase family protein [Chloroflexota bacterium]|nr:nucleotidyltransferase family protein [Chloroflexota bacterium]